MAKATKKKAAAKPRTKSQIYSDLAEHVGVTKKQIGLLFDGMSGMIKKDLTRGPKMFTIPGLMKIQVKVKPATKSRKGINPRTGEECIFKAKPARKVVKVRPLKGLKDMVG